MYDAVIIGAGPAGTAAGYALARANRRVLILDRHRFPRKKACAGGITPKTMQLFPYDISHLVLRICHRVKVTRPGGGSFTVREDRPLCYMVQRRDLDLFSLDKSMEAGAEFRNIGRILSLKSEPSGVSLTLVEKGKEVVLKAKFIIGADGANSRIRQLLSRRSNPRRRILKYPALEADVSVDSPEKIPMAFDFSRGIPGYFWVFPRHDHVNIGIYSTSFRFRPDLSLLTAFALDRLGVTRLGAVKGYSIGGGLPWRLSRLCGNGCVLLAGDAAGLAEPLLGEGLYAAVFSGQMAGQAIARSLDVGGTDALAVYRASLARLRLDLGLYHMAAGLMYRFPGPCLSLGRHSWVYGPFGRGYAAGRTLSHIVLPF